MYPMTRIPIPGYKLGLSTLLQRFGAYDPSVRWQEDLLIKAFWTPHGACTLALRQAGTMVEVEAVGDGADWTLQQIPRMFALAPQELPQHCPHAGLRKLSRELKGLRVGPFPWPFDTAVAFIFQQRVRFSEAARSYVQLVNRHGLPAPGPLPLRMPLAPGEWKKVGLNRLQQAGLDAKRARTLLRLDELRLDFQVAELAALPGVGPWTLESVKGYGFGDPDAVPVGDLHIPRVLGLFLVGNPMTDDAAMLRLLEPYRGLRFRVINWIMASSGRRAFGSLE